MADAVCRPLVRLAANCEKSGAACRAGRIARVTEKRRKRMKKKNIGSSFDSWLREERIYEEVAPTAIKHVLARQVAAAMKEKHFSNAEMARLRWSLHGDFFRSF